MLAGSWRRRLCVNVYISVDIEGIAGVTSRNHSGADGIDYGRAREWMTGTAVAAAEAALGAGAERVTISDGHGAKENILIDRLPIRCRLVRGGLRPLGMMQGIDADKFDAAMLLGYHAGASAIGGVLAHTNRGSLREVRLNGRIANEAMFNSALAGECGVPVVLASGDDVFAAELATFLPRTECVVVQQSHGALAATAITPAAAEAAIRAAVPAALARAAEVGCFVVAPPIIVELDFKHRKPVEVLAYTPWVERIAASTIRYHAASMREAVSIFSFLMNYDANLTG